jgi:hypothetical protein
MKAPILLFLAISFHSLSYGQIDTLIVNFGGGKMCYIGEQNCELKDSILNCNSHKLFIEIYNDLLTFSYLPDLVRKHPYRKKDRKHDKELIALLDKRLQEVKVLIIQNPTNAYIQDSSNIIKYDTNHASIYKLNFLAMTNLNTVYIIGNDTDDIIDMPAHFYSTSVSTIYCYMIGYPNIFQQNIQKKNKSINVILGQASSINYLKILNNITKEK